MNSLNSALSVQLAEIELLSCQYTCSLRTLASCARNHLRLSVARAEALGGEWNQITFVFGHGSPRLNDSCCCTGPVLVALEDSLLMPCK